MLETTERYRSAITGTARRTRVRIPLRVVGPDMWCGHSLRSAEADYSRALQVYDGVVRQDVTYATLEPGYWVLDGSAAILPETRPETEVGYVTEALSGADGAFSEDQYFYLALSGVQKLQALTLYFPERPEDGVASALTVRVLQGGTIYYTQTVTGNTASRLLLTGFTVYDPDEIQVYIHKWSLPYRRARLLELVPGFHDEWTEDDLVSLSLKMQASMSGVTLPYGSAALTLDNSRRIFDPRNKEGLFTALEERQAVPIEIGVDTDSGTEYLPCGVWYIRDRGWTTGSGGLTIRWDLVDVIGLLSETTFTISGSLPTTLSGWAAALMAQLGKGFASRYAVDADYASFSLTAEAEDVEGKSCGDILRWLCQAAGVFARADAQTGYLALEPFWSQGAQYTLDDLEDIPTLSANDSLGAVSFRLPEEELVVPGNTAASSNTLTVDNPFLTTAEQALKAAQRILSVYGGNRISATGRGDMSSELGDVATVQLDGSHAASARLTSLTLEYSGGVLRGCRLEGIQPDGVKLYQEGVILTENGWWTAPAGVTALSLILVGGGQAGGHGGTGEYPSVFDAARNAGRWVYGSQGENGTDGTGGRVWYGTVSINPEQSFLVHIGQGGTPSEETGADPSDGEATTFGSFSSANGRVYTPSFTDLSSGSAFGRTGVELPAAYSGDGGAGGEGGIGGALYYVSDGSRGWTEYDRKAPGTGSAGAAGGSGCVVIYYDKEAVS